MEDIGFTVRYILDDGSDAYGYDSNFEIMDGILYHGATKLTQDTDIDNIIENIIEFCHNTVIDIIDDNDNIIYHNEEFDDEEIEFEDGSEPYSDDKELRYQDYFGESFKRYNETLKKALGD